MDVVKRLEAVEAENDMLRERVAMLEALLLDTIDLPIEWRLTGNEACVFGVLVNREIATKEALMAALYRDRGSDEPMEKILDVYVCKLRRKLLPFGVVIKTVWGKGWSLPPEVRTQWRIRPRTSLPKAIALATPELRP